LPFVLGGRLGAHHELHRWPQLGFADLDDVVTFLAQRGRNGPRATHRNVHQDHPDAEILDIGDHLREILFGADHKRVTDRPVARQGGQVPVDLAFYSLPAAWPHPAHPELHARQVGEGFVLGGAAALHRGLVPVAPEQRQAGPVACNVSQDPDYRGIVPGNGIAVAGAVDGHRAIP
jgi:hypothetical protein